MEKDKHKATLGAMCDVYGTFDAQRLIQKNIEVLLRRGVYRAGSINDASHFSCISRFILEQRMTVGIQRTSDTIKAAIRKVGKERMLMLAYE